MTGGTGFIGSHLVEYLLAKNIEVYALVRNLKNVKFLKGLNIHFLHGDLFSIPPLPSDLQYVFHLAGLTKALKLVDYYTVNHLGTASLFKSLRQQRIFPKVIYLSSLAAAGPSLGTRGRKESDPPRPVTPYGKSKLKGEEETLRQKNEFPLVILRVGAVIGPRDRDFLVYLKFAKRGILTSFGFKQRYLSICFVKDLVRALYQTAVTETDNGDIFNIGDPTPYTYEDIGLTAGKILGKKLRHVRIPLQMTFLWAAASDAYSFLTKRPSIVNTYKYIEMTQPGWVTDVSKAREKLSFETRYSLEEALKEIIRWYIEKGWL
ncbi:MAG: NAD(P)-dependent oxidoreductase [Candidatus Aminicenantales bacterium]